MGDGFPAAMAHGPIEEPDQVDIEKEIGSAEKLAKLGVQIDGEELRERAGLPAAKTPERALRVAAPQVALDGALNADGNPVSGPGPKRPQKPPGEKDGPPVPKTLSPAFLELLKSTAAGIETAKASVQSDGGVREPDFIDRTTDEAIDDWAPLVEPLLSSFEALAEECTDLLQFQSRLAEGLAGMDSAAFEELLARGLFAAKVTGLAKPEG